jgi:hypothetical protein
VYSATEIALALGGLDEKSVRRLWDSGSLPYIVLTDGEKKPRRGTLHRDLLAFLELRRNAGAGPASVPSGRRESSRQGRHAVVPMVARRRRGAGCETQA